MKILDSIRLLLRKDKRPYLQLKDILGFYPKNIRLYKLALQHKSVSYYERENENRRNGKSKDNSTNAKKRVKSSQYIGRYVNNERLEFLGDAVLSAVVADILYKHYAGKQEGFLTTLRSRIVCRKSLNKLAVDIGLDKLVHYTGVVTTGHNSFMNGNAFEAFFGAIYLDRGYSYCYRFMEEVVFRKYINVDEVANQEENFKSNLIEWCQRFQYKTIFTQQEKREDNAPKFVSEVRVEGVLCGKGEGYSKKESDQAAAKDALSQLQRDKNLPKRIRRAMTENKEKARRQASYDKTIKDIEGRDIVIFDLDGTLLNTLDDLANSTNRALTECGYPVRTRDEVREFVGNGVDMLIKRAVPQGTTDEDTAACLSSFKKHYLEHCRDNTKPYAGVSEMLDTLRKRGYKMAVVSNKMQEGVTELCDTYFKGMIDVAVGCSDDVSKKPSPDMVEKALRQLFSDTSKALYVGDSEVDVMTAASAGLPCVSVSWGFKTKEFLYSKGATMVVDKPATITSLLGGSSVND